MLNCNLFKYFKYKDKKFSNIISYGNEIKRKLDNQEAIVISKSATKKVDGFFVREDSSVMAIASKGRDYFINYYFNVSEENTYARLKHDVEEDEVPQIIKTLFEWNYFTGIVEGSITIFNIKFCEK